MQVLGEAGKKEGLAHTVPLVDDARACLAAGAWKVMLEAADVFPAGQEPQAAVQDLLAQGLQPNEAIFELPGHWIPGTTYADPPRIYRQLLAAVGPEVNVANVMSDRVIEYETIRCGIGVNAASGAVIQPLGPYNPVADS